jgi:uncharacterized cupin superfamily protein
MTTALMLHRADGAPLSTSFRKKDFGESDPFAGKREVAWEGPDSMVAARVSFIGELEVPCFPHIETLVVVEGELILTVAGAAPLVIGPHEGAVIGHGTAISFQARSRTRFVSCAAAGDGQTKPGLIPMRADADFKPSAAPPAEALLGTAPDCRSDNVFTDELSQYRAGTWDSTPYWRAVRPHRLNEVMHLLAGSVRFASPDGSVLSAAAGDALFVPQGARIGWESKDHVTKFYVVQSVHA